MDGYRFREVIVETVFKCARLGEFGCVSRERNQQDTWVRPVAPDCAGYSKAVNAGHTHIFIPTSGFHDFRSSISGEIQIFSPSVSVSGRRFIVRGAQATYWPPINIGTRHLSFRSRHRHFNTSRLCEHSSGTWSNGARSRIFESYECVPASD
jgi:hypothetical protein